MGMHANKAAIRIPAARLRPQRKRKPDSAWRKKPYCLSVAFDFPDDLRFAPYTRASLEDLFRRYRAWGITRIYWIHTWKHAERLWAFTPCRDLSRHYAATARRLGDFLPVAVELAHALGMELYAVYKPFDAAFNETFPFHTPPAARWGRLDNLSGRIHWAADFLVRRQALRIQRRWDDVPSDLDRRTIRTIVLRSDQAGPTRPTPDRLTIWVSADNNVYRRYRGRVAVRREYGSRGVEFRLEGLRIDEPYLALRTAPGNSRAAFSNRLSDLVLLLDATGAPLPFTYGLVSRQDHYRWWSAALNAMGAAIQDGLIHHGYVFDWHNAAKERFLKTMRQALDNDRGYLALAKGKECYVTGALSPAYPEVRQVWLDHIRECLEAGVDGVDLRVANHNRSLEWENYGFERPVRAIFRVRYGREPDRRGGDTARRKAILGECYTEFVRAAGRLIRSRGKQVQVHIGQVEFTGGQLPIDFEWARWLREGLADEVTLITDAPARDFRRIRKAMGRRRLPVHFRQYMKVLTNRPHWPGRLRRILRKTRALGLAGYIVYESAMVVRGRRDGRFEVMYPEIPAILQEFIGEPRR